MHCRLQRAFTAYIVHGVILSCLLQGLTGTLLWIGLSQLGNPASASRRSEEAAAHWLVLAKEKETEAKQEVSLLDDVLPSQLSRNAVVQQTLINAVLVSWVLLIC